MASIIKADDGVASGQTGIVYTADTSGTLKPQATSGLVTLQNVTGGGDRVAVYYKTSLTGSITTGSAQQPTFYSSIYS